MRIAIDARLNRILRLQRSRADDQCECGERRRHGEAAQHHHGRLSVPGASTRLPA